MSEIVLLGFLLEPLVCRYPCTFLTTIVLACYVVGALIDGSPIN